MEMNFGKLSMNRVAGLATLTLVVFLAAAPAAFGGNNVTPPPTPLAITPPSGNVAFALGNAVGTQGYVCLPSGSGASWTVNASRPQATLFITLFNGLVTQQIFTHFLSPDTNPNQYAPNPLPFGSPTWQSSFDSSVIWGNKQASITAGSDPSCPTTGAIPCLLLQVIGSANGPGLNNGILTHATYVQRLNTTGGAAPSTGCAASTDVGSQTLVPYTADYYFYKAQ
jgi:hypothetical protein